MSDSLEDQLERVGGGVLRRTLILSAAMLAVATKIQAKERYMMPKIEDVFLLIITDKMAECQKFYETHFGFSTVFDSKVYLQLSSPEHDGRSFSLAFMPIRHPFGVVPQMAASGQGIMLTIQTADVDALHTKIVSEDVPVIHGPKSEPWGQRRFDVRDPAGTFVDVVQSIDPQPGWFDQFK